MQSSAPRLLTAGGRQPDEVRAAQHWALALAVVSAALGAAVTIDAGTTAAVIGGLVVFGVVFALNSSLHSFLILAYTTDDNGYRQYRLHVKNLATGDTLAFLSPRGKADDGKPAINLSGVHAHHRLEVGRFGLGH